MPKNKPRSKAQMEEHRARAADLYLKGWTHSKIAQALGVHQTTVTRDMQEVRKQWQATMLASFDEKMAEELAKIARVEREAWAAWERSVEAARTVQRHVVHNPGERQQEGEAGQDNEVEWTKVTSKEQAGDPRFLVVVGQCIERRCKLLGLDAPEKIMVSYRDLTQAGNAIGQLLLTFVPEKHHELAMMELRRIFQAASPLKEA